MGKIFYSSLFLSWMVVLALGIGCGQSSTSDCPPVNALPDWKNQYPYGDGWLIFPNDEGKHSVEQWPYTLMEWYAHYGHVKDEDGAEYSYFVTQVAYDSLEPTFGAFFPHLIFNLSDYKDTVHYSDANYNKVVGFSVGEAFMKSEDEGFFGWKGMDAPFEYEMFAQGIDRSTDLEIPFVLDVDMKLTKRPLVVNGTGYVKQGSGISGYYSMTRLDVEGTLTVGEQQKNITGFQWIDRQWLGSSFGANIMNDSSYEWWCIHLDNNEEAILYKIWGDKNRVTDTIFEINHAQSGGFREGVTDYQVENLDYWESPKSSNLYSHGWRLSSKTADWDLTITPVFDDQEAATPFAFWSGGCVVAGRVYGQEVTGVAYAELLYSYSEPQ